jgi:glycosyltransferase involved in cell wall biosynthesis
VAFIGTKGMPAVSGGVEAHVDELSRGLVRAGHEAVVYVRDWYTPSRLKAWRGVRLLRLPTLRTKHLDAAVHSLLASLHVLFVRADVIHYHAIGPAAFGIIPRLCGRRLVVTVHRRDWQADKWGWAARVLLKAAERAAVRIPREAIAVSESIREALAGAYGAELTAIPNGFTAPRLLPPGPAAARFGLKARGYILYLGRLVPEKRPDWLIRAFLRRPDAGGGLRLVIAGAASGTDAYARELRALAAGDPRIVFTGEVRGEIKDELFANALLFVLPSRLEGQPIALLEARGAGLACLASDIAVHGSLIRDGSDGRLFQCDDFEDFRARLEELLSDPSAAAAMGRRAREAMAAFPSWDEIVAQTLRVYDAAAARPPARAFPRRSGPAAGV